MPKKEFKYNTDKLKAISAEYMVNGNDKTKALMSAGYTRFYAERQGKRIFNNIQFIEILNKMKAKIELKTELRILDKLELQALWSEFALNQTVNTGDRLRASELLGKSENKAQFTENKNNTNQDIAPAISDDESKDLEQIAKEMKQRIVWPKLATG